MNESEIEALRKDWEEAEKELGAFMAEHRIGATKVAGEELVLADASTTETFNRLRARAQAAKEAYDKAARPQRE